MPTPLDYAWMILKQWDDLPENWGQPDAPANPQFTESAAFSGHPEMQQMITPWPEGTYTGWQYGPSVDGQRGPVLSAEEAEHQQPSRQPQGALGALHGQHRSLGGMSEPGSMPFLKPGLAGGRALQFPTASQQQAARHRYSHKPNSPPPYNPLPSFNQTQPPEDVMRDRAVNFHRNHRTFDRRDAGDQL